MYYVIRLKSVKSICKENLVFFMSILWRREQPSIYDLQQAALLEGKFLVYNLADFQSSRPLTSYHVCNLQRKLPYNASN